MLLTPWVLALTLQALPPCKLPDLSHSNSLDSAYQVKALPDGVIGVAMSDPMADDAATLLPGVPEESPPSAPHSKASAWLWSEASGWLLVPKGFEVSMAAVGVDGSWVIEMRDPKAPERRLRASNTGACVGCAYSNGAQYFEEYANAARENEFEFCEGLERPIVRDDASDQRLRFHFDSAQGTRHDAVASIGGEDIGYSELVVSGLDAATRDEVLAAFAQQ